MKKNLFLLIAFIATILCSCSSDDGNDNAPKQSQFIYSDNSILVGISIGNPYVISIFKNGECVYQNLYGAKVSGEYPIYTYTYNAPGYESDVHLKLTCSYSNPSSFTATVEYSNIIGENYSPHYKGEVITRPSTMLFKADNRILDVNGDGVLDEW